MGSVCPCDPDPYNKIFCNYFPIFLVSYNIFHRLVTVGIGMCGAAFVCVMTTNVQVSNYFTSGRGVVMNLIHGSVDSSASGALVLYYIYQLVGYNWTWTLYGILGLFVLFRTICILPIQHIPYVRRYTNNYTIYTGLEKDGQ